MALDAIREIATLRFPVTIADGALLLPIPKKRNAKKANICDPQFAKRAKRFQASLQITYHQSRKVLL